MGREAEKGFTSSGVDPSWPVVLRDLQKHDIDEADTEKDMALIKRFMREDRKDKFEAATNGGPKGEAPRRHWQHLDERHIRSRAPI